MNSLKDNSLSEEDGGETELQTQVSAVRVSQASFHRGPLPPPAMLQEYEDIVKGAANRIISMAEKEQEHRHEIEKRIIKSNIKNSKLGLWFGLIISIVALSSVVICVTYNAFVPASILGGSTVLGLAGVFVYGHKKRTAELTHIQKKERE